MSTPTNGIEILIDVLSQEAVTSTDEFINVITDAAGKVGILSGSIDGLDTALSGIAKSGASAEDMSAKLVSTLEEFGIQVQDADGLSAAFEGTLKGLGAAGKEAASGIDLVTKANEEVIGPTNDATAAVERQGGAFKTGAISADEFAASMKGVRAAAVTSAVASEAALADLGTGYARMTTLSKLATPALMKAATWAGIGLAGLAYEGIKQYTQFQKLITQTITQAGVAPSKMGFLTNLAESVAKSTGQGLDDVANTIYRAASGTASWNNGLGATKKQLGDIVTQVSRLNVVGGIASGAESEQASRVVTALLNSNIRGVGHDATSAAALVNAVVGSGDMRLADLVPGIGRGLLSSAVANNMTAKDALAWVATLTSQGTTASVAGNYVKTGVNLLAHPSAQGVQALAMLGIKPGQLENLMSGPGGLVAALSTLSTGMKQLNPGSAAKFFYHEAGKVYPGGSGLAGAAAKLQTWSAGELPASFIKAWEAGKLNSKQQTEATDLILTKAFGGSKQFATIAAVLNHLGLLKGIEAHIGAEDTKGYFNAQYRRTEATPSQQFKRMGQSLFVDLVNIGHTLTPLGLTFGHVMTGVIGGLSKFKGVIMDFAAVALSLLAVAGVSKMTTLASHLSPLIGAGYNRLGLMMGENSKFTTAMDSQANGGAFKFLNIYGSQKRGILSKLGGESLMAYPPGSPEEVAAKNAALAEKASPGENLLNNTATKQVLLLEKIAASDQIIADEMVKGGATGGLANAGGRGGSVGSRGEQLALGTGTLEPGTRLSASYGGGAIPLTATSEELMAGSVFQDAKTGRWTKRLAGGRTTFITKAEAMASMEQPPGSSVPRDATYYKNPNLGGVDMGEGAYGPAVPPSLDGHPAPFVSPALLAEDAAKTAVPAAEDLGGGLMSSLGGLAGSPMGMMAMMAAPMLIGFMSPLIGKLGGLLGDWLGGGSSKPFTAHIKGAAVDSVQAAAKLQKDIKNLRQYQTEIKNKSGKEEWVRNMSAYLADPLGYDKALKKYQLASHTYTGSTRNSNAISSQAISALYGPERGLLSREEREARTLAGHMVTVSAGKGGSVRLMEGLGTEAQMRALASHLPGTSNSAGTGGTGLRGSILSMMNHRGANWQDFSKLIAKDKSVARGIFADTAGSSAQTNAAHNKFYSALDQGGYFQTGSNLSLNTKEMKKALSERGATAAKAAQFLPQYAHLYHLQAVADHKALLTKNLPDDAKKYFERQETSAENSAKSTDKLIETMRKVAGDTKLDNESVNKLATQNAKALAAIGLTPHQIAVAIAQALSPYIKTSTVVGTGGTVTASKLFSPVGVG